MYQLLYQWKKKYFTKSNTHHYKNSHKTGNIKEFPQFDKVHLQKTPKTNKQTKKKQKQKQTKLLQLTLYLMVRNLILFL